MRAKLHWLLEFITAVAAKSLLLLAIGAITVAVSELWFYPVTDNVSTIGILLFYGVIGYAFLLLLDHYRVLNFWGMYIAATAFGLLVEGVPVPVLFTALPFTIVWTSLAWHALITIVVGWYLFGRLLAADTILKPGGLLLGFGLLLGTWNSYMWNVTSDDATGAIHYSWSDPTTFVQQFLLGYALFMGGHWLFSQTPRRAFFFTAFERWLTGILLAVTFLAGSFIIAFPLSLVLPILLLPCWWALRRQRATTGATMSTMLARVQTDQPTLRNYILSVILPVAAISSYWLCYIFQIELEMNALVILTAGPLSVFLLGLAFYRIG